MKLKHKSAEEFQKWNLKKGKAPSNLFVRLAEHGTRQSKAQKYKSAERRQSGINIAGSHTASTPVEALPLAP
jgi:hypothetical protein